MTSHRRTELGPFILDLLDFMHEKISEAVADETSRPGAVSEAAGLPIDAPVDDDAIGDAGEPDRGLGGGRWVDGDGGGVRDEVPDADDQCEQQRVA